MFQFSKFGLPTFAELTELLIDLAQSQGSRLGDVSFGDSKVDVLRISFITQDPPQFMAGQMKSKGISFQKMCLPCPPNKTPRQSY